MIQAAVMFFLGLFLYFGVSPDDGEELEHGTRKSRMLADMIGEENYIRFGKGMAILLMLGGIAMAVRSFLS